MKKLSLLLLIFILTASSCKKEKNRICEIYEGEKTYAIGTIYDYDSGISKVTYKYSYSINGVSYNGEEKAYGIGQLDERLIGGQYLVVCKASDLSESDLNLYYSIDSQAEFTELQTDFSTTPPDSDWPDCD